MHPSPGWPPHHDIALEEEGRLQADAELLRPGARDVTEEERTGQRLNGRQWGWGGGGGVGRQEGAAGLGSEPQ